jgi:putative transcriptional regulator
VGEEVFILPLVYKIDVLQALKDKGFTTYRLRHDKLLSESTIQKLRNNKGVAWENIETLCGLLECQPADLIAYEKGEDVAENAD